MAAATLVQVMEFFDFAKSETAKFRGEWGNLTPEDQKQIKEGIGDGSLTY